MSLDALDVFLGLLANAGELAVLFLVALLMEWVVLGSTYRRERDILRKELQFWRELGITQMDQTGHAVGLLDRLHL